MTPQVADASIVLALLEREPGHEKLEQGLASLLISTVNLAEVVTSLINKGFSVEEARVTAQSLQIETAPFDAELALDAGALREITRARGLSLGDRACLALGRKLGARVLTTDRAWAGLDVGVEIELIR